MKRALEASLEITPNNLEKAVFTQRAQISEQLETMRKALDGDDFDLCSISAGHVSRTARALHENLEMMSASRIEMRDAATETLEEDIRRRAKGGDKYARKLVRAIDAGKKEPARGPR